MRMLETATLLHSEDIIQLEIGLMPILQMKFFYDSQTSKTE
jgi:hypothetical protein